MADNMTSLHEIESICTSCAEGCGFHTQVEQGKVTNLDYMKAHPVNKGGLCFKGNGVLESIYHPSRIYSPLERKEDGTFDAVSWDHAITTIASRFKQIAKKHGPDALAFLTAAHCTNEEYYVFQKCARLLGTNNIDCSSSHEGNAPSRDLAASLGSAAITNPFSDLANAQCIFITGSNFLDNHPVVSYWIFEAKAKGATVICADHRRPPSLLFCDHFLQIQPGTQAILIDGMILHILEKQLHNKHFIEEHTSGFGAFQKALSKQSLKVSEKVSGISVAQIKEVAELYATASASALIQALDFSPLYGNHTATALNSANLALLCGHLGRPGTGVFPLAHHSNSQGSADMGIAPQTLPGPVPLKDQAQHTRIAKLWKTKELPKKEGLSLPAVSRAPKSRRVKALYLMESNPLQHSIHADQLKKLLKGTEFLVVQDCFLTETAKHADIILPALSWGEKTGTYTTGERRVQWQPKIISPQENIIPGWQVICTIAKKLGFKNQFSFSNPEAILKEINKVIPDYAGLSPTRVKKIGGIAYPCPTPKHPGTPILYAEQFNTPDGRGKFIPVVYEKKAEKPTQKYPFRLTFGKAATSSSTPMGDDTNLLVEMNAKDAKRIPVSHGGEVKIATKLGSVKATVSITETVLPEVVFIPFLTISDLASPLNTVDPRVIMPELNTAVCQIKKSGGK
jgi:formate dehydrogenase major subunit